MYSTNDNNNIVYTYMYKYMYMYIYIYIYIKYPVCCSERHGVLSASIAEHQDHANRC